MRSLTCSATRSSRTTLPINSQGLRRKLEVPLLLPPLVGGFVLPSPAGLLPSLAVALQGCWRRRQAAAPGLAQPLHRACSLYRDSRAHVMVCLLSSGPGKQQQGRQQTQSPNLALHTPGLAMIAMMHPAVAGWLCGMAGCAGH